MQVFREGALRSQPHNLDIEILRAAAVGLTLFAHLEILLYWQSPAFRKITDVVFFWGGVDIFFCISGYVITASLLREHPRIPSFSKLAIPFWIRRFWRLTPSAIFWLLVVVLMSALPINDGHLRSVSQNLMDLASATLYVANVHFWSCYAGESQGCGINQVYWSLSLEEQCYLLLPVLVYTLGWKRLPVALVLIIAAQALLYRPILSLLWFVRTDALAAGVLIALAADRGLLKKIEPKFLGWRPLGLTFFALCILSIGMLAAKSHVIQLHTTCIMLVAAVLVWAASYGNSYLGISGRAGRLVAYIGSRSYALYLTHVPVYYLAKPVSEWAGVGAHSSPVSHVVYVCAALGTALLLAEANFRFIEVPLRAHGRTIAARWTEHRSQ
ncbi:acyltransferase [Stenotrophomonas geniculata]|uniref:Acyltransferase n=1 Tax=Stenotrophomonas geniculata TaxID=86188 RepID=A0AAP5C5Y9_9GAMM|nr:acyltransferase [Stenotrophomonas geniculata]MBH1448726.1 acyltransferase [Stenotrophomonas maltophilia]MDP4309057.1 acyltransferase [Stenotrophomonas geniculata]MDQ7952440.1 acyltransferase [Stenotrophomonas geniculata]